jgi:16S rRNA (adenine1518-N6/adenine1519-N6)-dimethyltransferase
MSKAPRTKKSLGQHFLHDGNIIRKIVGSIPANPDDKLVEIGPGSGAMTEVLVQRFDDVTVIEVDRRMVDHLKERFNGIEIIHSDILDYDWKKLENPGKPVHVVGNLPYYITSQILFHLLRSRRLFESATVMMQKEVAVRHFERSGAAHEFPGSPV